MARLPFGEYRPDLDDNLVAYTKHLLNVVPLADGGYGPFRDFTEFSSAAQSACRGYAYARNPDGSVSAFLGTATRLWRLQNTDFTFADVSKGGAAYPGLPAADQWQFQQFNNLFFATQINAPLQVISLTSPTAFADAAGTPPQARYITAVGRFLVLSGISGAPYRVQWSGLNNVNAATSWDNITAQSNYQDMADGGLVRGVGGGEYGLITQDGGLRRMTYAPGTPAVFQIERISEEKGIFAPLSLTRSGDRLFWIASDGFKMLSPGGYPMPIGKGKVDETFFKSVDTSNLQLCIGASDPRHSRVLFVWKSLSGAAGLFDNGLIYDWALERFTPLAITGEYLATLAKPGLTLEALDPIAPGAIHITGAANNGAGLIRLTVSSTAGWATNDIKAISNIVGTTEANGNWKVTVVDGTHIDLQGSIFANAYVSGGVVGGSLDDIQFSLDEISVAALAELSAVNNEHKIGFFTGENLEAVLETAEQAIDSDGGRLLVKDYAPISDASTVQGSISYRETLQATAVYSPELPMNGLGRVPVRRSTRYARARIRIPRSTDWTYAKAVEPKFGSAGQR